MFMKVKTKLCGNFQQDAYNYNIYLIITGLPDLATHL